MIVFAESESASPADSLADLPPSAKLVYKVLEYDAPLTQAEVRSRSRLGTRTTRHAISILRDADVIETEVYPPDARMRQYRPCLEGGNARAEE